MGLLSFILKRKLCDAYVSQSDTNKEQAATNYMIKGPRKTLSISPCEDLIAVKCIELRN